MEENVALDSKKQKKFVKSIKGIKKLIKKNEGKLEGLKKDDEKPQKPFSMKMKGGKIHKKKKPKRGLVYLSHIPHGFYEQQMTEYFKQFGVVTNARVIRSKRTGRAKGFAFVEFKEPSVGQIVAETMNNYLMGKRLIKASYIPPEKQRKAFRKNWNDQHNPTSVARMKNKKFHNTDKDEAGELAKAKNYLNKLLKTKKKLKALGVDYDFFTPVDVPEALLNRAIKSEKEDENDKKELKKESKDKTKKNKNETVETIDSKVKQVNTKVTNSKIIQNGKQENKNKKNKDKPSQVAKKEPTKETNKKTLKVIKNEKPEVNKKLQKQKENKLKEAGVKEPEFIAVGSGDESDSSCDFDSDEYEKVLAYEDGSDASGDSDNSDDDKENENQSEDDDESEEPEVKAPPPKKTKVQAKQKPLPQVPGKVNKNKRRRSQKRGKKQLQAKA